MHKKDKHTFFYTGNQSKIIILFGILSALLIFFTAYFVINKTSQKITDTYYHFALTLSKSISASISANISDTANLEKSINDNLFNLVKNNKEIAFIDYKNNKLNIQTYKGTKTELSGKNSFIINTPLIENGSNIGSIDIGFTGNSITDTDKITKISIIMIFSVMWILSLIAVFINTFVVTRQIALLSYGVKKISSGEFGYKLKQDELWGEIKLLFNEFNNMSVRLRQYEEKNIDNITYEKNKLEAVLMSIANGVIVCDSSDNIILLNNAGSNMLSVTSSFIGENINFYTDNNGNFPFKEYIAQFKETPLDDMKTKPLDFQININNRIFKVLISPMFTINEEYLGYIVVLHDITKEAEVDKLKSTFISNVSHELRTPVTVLRSYIDTLYNYSDDFDEATKQEFLQIMNQESLRLNNMINDILDFSRMESSTVKVEKEFLFIQPIIENTVKSMSLLAQEKNLSFEVSISPDLPKVFINQDSIERVMNNLLSNAVKYSNSDNVINVTVEKDSSKNNIICTVEDFGIGISQENLEKVFDRFYRVENKTHTVKGTGLGLHLVKVAIEEQHNGKVFVESQLNKGSKFGFILPIEHMDEYKNNNLNNIETIN